MDLKFIIIVATVFEASLLGFVSSRMIVGGSDALPREFPHMVLVRIDTRLCGGSLIARNLVLTAGHCVANGTQASDIVIISGTIHKPPEKGDKFAEIIRAKKIILHPHFSPIIALEKEKTYGDDVALIVMEREIQRCSREVRPVALPWSTFQLSGFTKFPNSRTIRDIKTRSKSCYVSGWGRINTLHHKKRILPKTLQKLSVSPFSIANYRILGGLPFPGMFKAGHPDLRHPKSPCRGDSGSPLVCQIQGHWEQIGVVSFGPDKCTTNAIYADLTYYNNWIHSEIKKDKEIFASFYNSYIQCMPEVIPKAWIKQCKKRGLVFSSLGKKGDLPCELICRCNKNNQCTIRCKK